MLETIQENSENLVEEIESCLRLAMEEATEKDIGEGAGLMEWLISRVLKALEAAYKTKVVGVEINYSKTKARIQAIEVIGYPRFLENHLQQAMEEAKKENTGLMEDFISKALEAADKAKAVGVKIDYVEIKARIREIKKEYMDVQIRRGKIEAMFDDTNSARLTRPAGSAESFQLDKSYRREPPAGYAFPNVEKVETKTLDLSKQLEEWMWDCF